MRILYIDPLSLDGHINFNKIHIKALKSLGADVDFCFIEGYGKKLGLDASELIYDIPKFLDDQSNGLKFRLSQYRILRQLRHSIDFERYDRIIFSCFEQISFSFAGIRDAFLICHNNISDNKLKRFFLKKVGKRNSLLYMLKGAKDWFDNLGVTNKHYVFHGLINPELKSVSMESDRQNKFRFKIFSPSGSSSDHEFIQHLLESAQFVDFLKKQNIQFVLKGNYLPKDYPDNIRIINHRIPDSEYVAEFLSSDAILICYGQDFKYRVSGVMMESIAFDKPVLVRDIPSLREFTDIVGENSYFGSIDDFINAIKHKIDQKIGLIKMNYPKQQPDYQFLLD